MTEGELEYVARAVVEIAGESRKKKVLVMAAGR
jgi:hypothetical protein